MSTYLSAQSLSVAFSSTPLFEGVSFTVSKGEKIGLIGHNGCGKSSLMKLLSGSLEAGSGQFSLSGQCVMAYVEQHIPASFECSTLLEALADKVAADEIWRAQLLLSELGFDEPDWQMPVSSLSGGQQMRLLLARAVIGEPDLLLLDEPSNHLDLPALLWLERFLLGWKGSFVLVSHDQRLLDRVTNSTWIMRDRTLHHFNLPCSQARQALSERDEADLARHNSEQKEIDRLEQSAKRLAVWGKVYDNEDLARKAKTMQARKERLAEQQTQLTEGAPWTLTLKGEALPANRLLDIEQMTVRPPGTDLALFEMLAKQVKSGDRVAVLGANGSGKSTLLGGLYRHYLHVELQQAELAGVNYHPRCRLGYYDQSLYQVKDHESLSEALERFAPLGEEARKMALISAGFEYQRHQQMVATLSGGERARLLFIGLTLACYHLLFLDEPTNHLDLEGKEELIDTLQSYQGGALIVSHDRALIEQGCNRFWLIRDGGLEEYLDVDDIYAILEQATMKQTEIMSDPVVTLTSDAPGELSDDSDKLLERLIELESLLEEDLSRKARHQKPALQEKWRSEINTINTLL